jgi:hypothetical protein
MCVADGVEPTKMVMDNGLKLVEAWRTYERYARLWIAAHDGFLEYQVANHGGHPFNGGNK